MTDPTETVIHYTEARRIASDWHAGQSSALYRFASTGAIRLSDALAEIAEVEAEVRHTDISDLADYVTFHGNRGPVRSPVSTPATRKAPR